MTHQVTHQDTPNTHQDPPGAHRFVPMAEAVRILGLSATTLRRKIASGELEAERVTRPQGEAWLIRVTGDPPPATVDPPGARREPPGTLQESPGASHHVPLGTDVLTVVVAPLLAEVAASRQIIERQADQLVSMAETIGELKAQNRALLARTAPESAEPTTEAPPARSSSTTWLTPRRFWIIAVLVLVLIGVGVVQVTVMVFSLAAHLAMPW